jgi:hypothetical protein
MDNEVAEAVDFQTRMFNKIREQMGELMTTKELKALVDKAMEKAFFEEREVTRGYNTEKVKPYFVELVQKELESQVRIQLTAYMKEHSDEVIKAIDETIAKGFYSLVKQHQDNMISTPLWNFAEQLRQKGIML